MLAKAKQGIASLVFFSAVFVSLATSLPFGWELRRSSEDREFALGRNVDQLGFEMTAELSAPLVDAARDGSVSVLGDVWLRDECPRPYRGTLDVRAVLETGDSAASRDEQVLTLANGHRNALLLQHPLTLDACTASAPCDLKSRLRLELVPARGATAHVPACVTAEGIFRASPLFSGGDEQHTAPPDGTELQVHLNPTPAA